MRIWQTPRFSYLIEYRISLFLHCKFTWFTSPHFEDTATSFDGELAGKTLDGAAFASGIGLEDEYLNPVVG